jgi:hypothetical protein
MRKMERGEMGEVRSKFVAPPASKGLGGIFCERGPSGWGEARVRDLAI